MIMNYEYVGFHFSNLAYLLELKNDWKKTHFEILVNIIFYNDIMLQVDPFYILCTFAYLANETMYVCLQ